MIIDVTVTYDITASSADEAVRIGQSIGEGFPSVPDARILGVRAVTV